MLITRLSFCFCFLNLFERQGDRQAEIVSSQVLVPSQDVPKVGQAKASGWKLSQGSPVGGRVSVTWAIIAASKSLP